MSDPGRLRLVRTKSEQIADYYAALMSDDRIRPGDKLPSVEQIVDIFAVGKRAAHDAIRELQRRGLARSEHGRGTFAA
jgi:GntR family transcriptional repressor for pyruvate dehydrogenase complex